MGYISNDMKRYNYLLGEMESAYHEAAQKLHLSDSALKILYAICDNGESCLLQNICTHTGLSKQTVNSALRRLETESILYLESASGKSKNVVLSEKGKRLAKQTAFRIIQIENDIFASWKKEEVEQYLELTERFLNTLKRKTKEL